MNDKRLVSNLILLSRSKAIREIEREISSPTTARTRVPTSSLTTICHQQRNLFSNQCQQIAVNVHTLLNKYHLIFVKRSTINDMVIRRKEVSIHMQETRYDEQIEFKRKKRRDINFSSDRWNLFGTSSI